MKKKTKYLILILSIVAALVLIACGFLGVHLYNKFLEESAVESAVYRHMSGQMFCFACSERMDCCPNSKIHLMGPYDTTPLKRVLHNITKVSAKPGMVKDVWTVTTESDCPGGRFPSADKFEHWHDAGVLRWVEEYSYVEGKLKKIRGISCSVNDRWRTIYSLY